jgi:hypothetical protein
MTEKPEPRRGILFLVDDCTFDLGKWADDARPQMLPTAFAGSAARTIDRDRSGDLASRRGGPRTTEL